MSAVGALKAARAAGVHLGIDGDGLVLEAASAPPAAVLDALSRHKAEIVALLGPGRDGWSAEDWQIFFEERAGIVEFDGGLPRPEARAQAFACCVVEWLNRNPERSPAGRCLGCGDREHAHDSLLPYGTEPNGHVWLHSRCWPGWYEARKAKAVSTLAAMGIETGGIKIFPRLIAAEHHKSFIGELSTSGVAELDTLLGGGLERGTSALLVGGAGVGKSSIAVTYAVGAAKRGERVAMFAFDEGLGTLFARAAGLGVQLEDYVEKGLIRIQQIDPAEMSPGEFTLTVRDAVEKEFGHRHQIGSNDAFLLSRQVIAPTITADRRIVFPKGRRFLPWCGRFFDRLGQFPPWRPLAISRRFPGLGARRR